MSARRAFFVLGTILLTGCHPYGGSSGGAALTDAYRPECPHDWPDSLRFKGDRSVAPVSAMLTGPGPIKDVPEFNDCQRFIVREGKTERYDSLFAIFATYRLTRLDTLMSLAEGVRENPRQSANEGQTAYEGLTANLALPAAEIAAWNDYTPLGIRTGFNCLYLYVRNEAGNGMAWKAKMVSFGTTEEDCSKPVDPDTLSSTAMDLLVRPVTNPRLTSPGDYPPVARWQWDDRSGTEYVGIRCGVAWCGVSGPGVAGAPTYASTLPGGGSSLSAARFRVREVKGWYDAQYLAVPTTSGHLPRPSRIRGVIIPDEGLGGHNGPTDFDDQWVHAASVALDVPAGQTNPYESEFNLQATAPGADGSALNNVFLCHAATAGGCAGVPASTPVCTASTGWWVKVVNPAGGELYRCSTRRDMGSVAIPGTVRWRWILGDEGMWMRCINGCCEMNLM